MGIFCGLCAGRGRNRRNRRKKSASAQMTPEERRATRIKIAKFAATLFFPIFLETMDYTVVAIAQSDIASYFNRLDLQTYIGTTYTLTSSVFLPLFAPFARVYGHHFTLQFAILTFLFGSALCTGATSMTMMLAGRGISGIGAAGLLAMARIILLDTMTGGDRNWQLKLMLWLYFPGFITGPVVGGLLTEVSFRWIFALNLPCCVLSSILSFWLLRPMVRKPEPYDPNDHSYGKFMARFLSIDWFAAILFVTGGILFLLGLNFGSTRAWNYPVAIAGLVCGFSIVALCLGWEYLLTKLQARNAASTAYPPRKLRPPFMAEPIIPLDLFQHYDTVAAFFATFTSGMVLFIVFYFTSIYYSIVLGLSPTIAGLETLFFVPGLLVGTRISAQIVRRANSPKYAACFGGAVLTMAVGLISYAVQTGNRGQLDGFVLLIGVGTGLSTNSLQIYLRQSQPFSRAPVVATLFLFFRSFGGTMGLAQCATVLNSKVSSYITEYAASHPETSGEFSSVSAKSLHSLDDIDNLPANIQQVVRDAFGNSVKFAFLSLIPWVGLAFLLMCRTTNNRGRHEERMEREEKKKAAEAKRLEAQKKKDEEAIAEKTAALASAGGSEVDLELATPATGDAFLQTQQNSAGLVSSGLPVIRKSEDFREVPITLTTGGLHTHSESDGDTKVEDIKESSLELELDRRESK